VQVGTPVKRKLYPEQRVSFPKGASGTSLKINIAANDLKRFVVGARAAQTLTVSVDTGKASLRLLGDADVTEGTNTFSAVLPQDGDYTFEVGNYSETQIAVTVTVRIR
jgi:hypothetical protein